jgi:hypothetical protein
VVGRNPSELRESCSLDSAAMVDIQGIQASASVIKTRIWGLCHDALGLMGRISGVNCEMLSSQCMVNLGGGSQVFPAYGQIDSEFI